MIHKKIKQLRLQKGWDQLTISEELGVSQSVYSKIETGKVYPDVSKLIKLVKIYNIDFNELLGDLHLTSRVTAEHVNQMQIYENEIKHLRKQLKVLEDQKRKLIEELRR